MLSHGPRCVWLFASRQRSTPAETGRYTHLAARCWSYLIFGQANAEEFIHVFVGQEEWLAKFLEFIVQQGLATNLVYNTLLEIYLRDDVRDTTPSLHAHHCTRATHDSSELTIGAGGRQGPGHGQDGASEQSYRAPQ